MVKLTDRPNMIIAVDWDVKVQIKQTYSYSLFQTSVDPDQLASDEAS